MSGTVVRCGLPIHIYLTKRKPTLGNTLTSTSPDSNHEDASAVDAVRAAAAAFRDALLAIQGTSAAMVTGRNTDIKRDTQVPQKKCDTRIPHNLATIVHIQYKEKAAEFCGGERYYSLRS